MFDRAVSPSGAAATSSRTTLSTQIGRLAEATSRAGELVSTAERIASTLAGPFPVEGQKDIDKSEGMIASASMYIDQIDYLHNRLASAIARLGSDLGV